MTRRLLLALAAAALALALGACSDDGFGRVTGRRRLVVELLPLSNPGARDKLLPLTVDTPSTFKVRVRALLPDGRPDTAFSSYVRMSARPGAIAPISSAGPSASGRNVLLVNGASEAVEVQLVNAFGTTYILADDLGYIPADPLGQPPPQCSDGKDNDGDGLVDYPADPGCAFANDDSELGGTFDQGASPPLFFPLPRVADVRGLKCDPARGCSGSGITPYQKDQVLIDTGFRESADGATGFAFDTVVVRVASNGFFVTDAADRRGGFTSLYAFNFNAPPKMRVCDRIKSLAGTASEFFGFTQLSYPTWTLEEWVPSQRPCLVPEPAVLNTSDITDTGNLLKVTGALVRAQTLPDRSQVTRVGNKLGPGDVPSERRPDGSRAPPYTPGPDATNCDYNRDGNLDFTPGSPEADCSIACTKDVDCIEYSNFKARSTFRLVARDIGSQTCLQSSECTAPPGGSARCEDVGKGEKHCTQHAAIQADASAAAGFDVLAVKGAELRAFTGTLTYFSGGNQYTIEARCQDDIVVAKDAQPFPSDKACVLPRNDRELNPQ